MNTFLKASLKLQTNEVFFFKLLRSQSPLFIYKKIRINLFLPSKFNEKVSLTLSLIPSFSLSVKAFQKVDPFSGSLNNLIWDEKVEFIWK